jgi:protocatechuate 3,4-dioxygenase beta subunit
MEEKFAFARLMFDKAILKEQKMNRIKQIESRRDFLKQASLAALAFPFLISCKTDTLAQKSGVDELSLIKKNAAPAGREGMGAISAPDNVSWKSVLTKKSDRDEPMIITGTVYQADGKTPAPSVLIYFYHTDSEGFYGRNGEPKHGHFQGWMLTDARGRYEFSSIKPAIYPVRKFAAHVHMTITGKNFKEDWIDAILFEGDRLISAAEREQAGKRGGFNPILKLEKGSDGILRGVRNIRLEKI